MGSNWGSAPLGELVDYMARGITPKYVEEHDPSGAMVLGQRCVRDKALDLSQARYHDCTAKPVKREKLVQRYDILVNAIGVGSAGRIAQAVQPLPEGCTTDSHVLTLRAAGVDPLYFGYFVKSKQRAIEGMAEGSTGQTEMNKARLSSEIVVTFPVDRELQRGIAEALLNLDRKIAINKRINGCLAEACEAIAEAADVDGESVLGDIATQVTTKVSCSEASIDSYVSTESLLPNKEGRQQASSLPSTGKVTVYQSGDTLVSNIRPYFKKVWYADRPGTCSSDVIVFRTGNPNLAPYLYSALRNDRFFEHVMAGVKGTKMPRGDKKQMMQFPISRACGGNELNALTAMVERISANNQESERLADVRDTLLPKLMSGEIDVSQIRV